MRVGTHYTADPAVVSNGALFGRLDIHRGIG